MLTKDGEAIVFHDETLDRTTNGTGCISDCTLEYIKTLDAGSWFHESFQNTKIPTLIEVIQLLNELDLHANIELKPCGDTAVRTTHVALGIVSEYWPKDKKPPLISSYNQQCLAQALIDYPQYPRALLLDEWEDNCCELATQYECLSINMLHTSLTSERINQIKTAGFLVYSFVVNTTYQAEYLEQLGINGIFTDNPRLFNPEKLMVLNQCANIIREQGLICTIQSTHEMVCRSMFSNNPVLIKFYQDNKLTSISEFFDDAKARDQAFDEDWIKLIKIHRTERASPAPDQDVIRMTVGDKAPEALAHDILNHITELDDLYRARHHTLTRLSSTFFAYHPRANNHDDHTCISYLKSPKLP